VNGKSIKRNKVATCPPIHTGDFPPPEGLSMKIYERIKFLRQVKNWSQEDMAQRLEMSINGYARIERGETDLQLSRLEQIAKTFDMDLSEFFGINEKTVFNLAVKQTNQNHWYISSTVSQIELLHELEKAHLTIEQQTKEIAYLKEIIEWMKKANSTD
jgi:transcriptional regulator with XRE-family HTH domain